MGRERFELSTFRLSAERSNQAELPALSARCSIICQLFLRIFRILFNAFILIFFGSVAQYGSRRRPSEPENGGSNPLGPAISSEGILIQYSCAGESSFRCQCAQKQIIALRSRFFCSDTLCNLHWMLWSTLVRIVLFTNS
jgi:hypothetical protein